MVHGIYMRERERAREMYTYTPFTLAMMLILFTCISRFLRLPNQYAPPHWLWSRISYVCYQNTLIIVNSYKLHRITYLDLNEHRLESPFKLRDMVDEVGVLGGL